ncbi:hypothetical protein ABBQ32_003295 [Trebouxia sp. C0010 RCD-2024]
MQKQPKSQTLRVLKAVALQRSGKDEEGLQVCEAVRREVPTDEQILNIMSIVYRRANRMKDMSAAFAAASAAHPRDEGLLRGVFVSYVRDSDFAGQQQIASKLHKLVGADDDYYVWWTIVAVTLQARAAHQGAASALPAAKLFQLAEIMTAKQAQQGRLQSYEQLSLYLHLLQAQGKHQQALQLAEGPLGDAISMPAERRIVRASLHVALKQLQQAAALFKEALLDSPDDWTSLQQYLDCMLPQSSEADGDVSDPQASGDESESRTTGDDPQLERRMLQLQVQDKQQAALQEAEKTIQQLLAKVDSDPRLKADAARGIIRGPQLAVVELQLRKLACQMADTTGSSQGHDGQHMGEDRREGGAAERQTSTTAGNNEGHNGHTKGGQERQGVQVERQEETRALAEAVLAYYRQLGHMLSCAVDLRAYTKRIQGTSRQWLAQKLQAELDSIAQQSCNGSQHTQQTVADKTGAAEGSPDMKQLLRLRQQISAYQIQHDLGLIPESAAEAEAHAMTLVRLYKHSLALCKGLDPKEKAPGDDLIPLAVASFMAARNLDTVQSRDAASAAAHDRLVQKHMMQALLVCEASQKRSTVFAASRFACTALYGLLGAAAPAAANFAALAIKHIQHDTITGHHMVPVALACQDTATLDQLLADTAQLFLDHDRDAADTIIMAFDKGTFTKVIEFVEFKERLESSHTLAVTTSEQSLIRIRKAIPRGFADVQSALQAASKDQSSELPSVEQLRFNEDLSTRPAWLPPCGDPWGGALIDWWHAQHFTQCDAGYGRCWWARPGAAELSDQDALALRQHNKRQLQIRRLMPRVMLQLTSTQTDSDQNAAAGKATAGAVAVGAPQGSGLSKLSALLGMSYAQLDSWLATVSPSSPQLPQRWPPEGEEQQDSPQPGRTHCSPSHAQQLISLATFAAADAGKEFWFQCCRNSAKSDSDSIKSRACVTTFKARLAAVQTAFSASCQHLNQQLKLDSDQMLLGSTILTAVHLVSEPAVWLSLCIMAWQHQFGAVSKKSGKKGKGSGVGEGLTLHQSEVQAVREELNYMQHAFCTSLQSIVDTVNVRLKVVGKAQLANATRAVLGDAGQASDLAQALSGCLSWAEIQAVLNSIITAQALTLKRIKLQASELMSAL